MQRISPSQDWRREVVRDNRLRAELEEAIPSKSLVALVVGVALLLMLGVIYFGPPTGSTTVVAAIEAPAR